MGGGTPIQYDVVISGMGITGLTTAWVALNRGKSVLIITNRGPEFLRIQRIFLDEELRDYLYRMVIYVLDESLSTQDKKFLQNLYSSTTLALKDIERFIFHRLEEKKKIGADIDFLYHSELSTIDLANGQACINSPKDPDMAVSFIYLVGADGSDRHALSVLNKASQQQTIAIEKSPIQPARTHHVSAYLTIERTDGQDLVLCKDELIVSQNQKEKETCAISLDRASYYKSNKKRVKCNFISELPDELYHSSQLGDERKNLVLNFVRQKIIALFELYKLANGELKITVTGNSKKYGSNKDKIKFLLFKSDITQAQAAALVINDHFFLLAGDAFRSPFYQTGLGATHGIRHAQLIARLFDREISITDYNRACEKLAKQADIAIMELATNKSEATKKAQDIVARVIAGIKPKAKKMQQTSSSTMFQQRHQTDTEPTDEKKPKPPDQQPS